MSTFTFYTPIWVVSMQLIDFFFSRFARLNHWQILILLEVSCFPINRLYNMRQDKKIGRHFLNWRVVSNKMKRLLLLLDINISKCFLSVFFISLSTNSLIVIISLQGFYYLCTREQKKRRKKSWLKQFNSIHCKNTWSI